MSVRAAVSDETHPNTRGVVYTSNSAAVHAVNGLRVRHGHEHDAAQQHCSYEQSCAQPALARVRTPSVQHLDVLGAARAAPGVLAVVSRSVHFSWYLLARLQVGVQMRLESDQRAERRFVRNLCSGGFESMRSGSAQYAESRRDLLAAAKHQITRSKELAGCKALA